MFKCIVKSENKANIVKSIAEKNGYDYIDLRVEDGKVNL